MSKVPSLAEKLKQDLSKGMVGILAVLDQGNSRKLINHLGLIVAPATLVALFCTLLGMSNEDNAAACLIATFFLALFRYRDYVDLRVRATWSLSALGIFLALYYFSEGDVELRQTGLTRHYASANDFLGESITEQFKVTKNEFFFVGTSIHITADLKRLQLLDMLKRGVDIKILALDKECKGMDVIAHALGNSPERLQSDCRDTYNILAEIREQWGDAKSSVEDPGILEIKFCNSLPTFRAYFFDYDNSGPAYLVPYIRGIGTGELSGHFYDEARGTIANKYHTSAIKLWDELPFAYPEIPERKKEGK